MSEETGGAVESGSVFDGITPGAAETTPVDSVTEVTTTEATSSNMGEAWRETAIPADVLGGKYANLGALVDGYSSSSGEAKKIAAERQALEAKLAGFTGAPVDDDGNPVDYNFELPEGFEEAGINENVLAAVNEIGRKHGASQDFMQDLFANAWAPAIAELTTGNLTESMAMLAEHFGSEEARDQKLGEVLDWSVNVLGEEKRNTIMAAGADPNVAILLSDLQLAWNATTLGTGSTGDGEWTEKDYLANLSRIGESPEIDARLTEYAERRGARAENNPLERPL